MLYRLHLGWLLGSRFLLLTHTGRKTGGLHQTVLEVIGSDASPPTYFVASGWGDEAQWFRNIKQNADVQVTVGDNRFAARARFLTPEQGEEMLHSYAKRNKLAGRTMFRLFHSNDPRVLSRVVPVVGFERTIQEEVADQL